MGSLADLWKECVRTPNDAGVWEQLLGTYWLLFSRIVVRVAHRFGVSTNDDIDDAMQEVCLKMSSQARLRKIPDIEGALLEAYLKASIANAAHDYFRTQRAKRRDVRVTTSIDEAPAWDLQQHGGAKVDRALLIQQIEHLVQGSARDRNVFFLYYRHGWTAREIAAIPSVSLTPKGVESLIFRMIAAVRDRMKPPPDREGSDKGFSQPSA